MDHNSLDDQSDKKNKELAGLFECPVCFDYAIPPILQCQSGHIVCAICRAKLNVCPSCRGPLDNIRNLALEKLAMTIQFPCKYSSCGCSESLHYTKKKVHEDACEFRPYLCPCPDSSCKWVGQLENVMNHLLSTHKNITTLQGEDIVFLATDIALPGAVDWVMMQSCFDNHFMLVLEKQERMNEQRFFAIVRLIGTRKQAKQFAYRLELSNNRRRLTWDATPCSIHDTVQTAIANCDCLALDASTAHLFAKNGNLGINVTIWQTNSNSSKRLEANTNAISSAVSVHLAQNESNCNTGSFIEPNVTSSGSSVVRCSPGMNAHVHVRGSTQCMDNHTPERSHSAMLFGNPFSAVSGRHHSGNNQSSGQLTLSNGLVLGSNCFHPRNDQNICRMLDLASVEAGRTSGNFNDAEMMDVGQSSMNFSGLDSNLGPSGLMLNNSQRSPSNSSRNSCRNTSKK